MPRGTPTNLYSIIVGNWWRLQIPDVVELRLIIPRTNLDEFSTFRGRDVSNKILKIHK